MLTRDDVELTIPNGIMGNSKIVNESGGPHPKFRIRIPVGAAYGSDVERVKSVLFEAATANEHVCEDPEPRIRFRQFGPSSLDFELLCWVEQPSQRGMVVDLLLTAINRRFNEEGLEIPFAKQDVYIKENAGKRRRPAGIICVNRQPERALRNASLITGLSEVFRKGFWRKCRQRRSIFRVASQPT